MKNSVQRIRTSHVGRLPVPLGFEETPLRLVETAGDVFQVREDEPEPRVGAGYIGHPEGKQLPSGTEAV
jgi:hypothetical protein